MFKLEIIHETKKDIKILPNEILNEVLGDYEYDCYDMLGDFSNGSILESVDGGICTGSAIDTIEMIMKEK